MVSLARCGTSSQICRARLAIGQTHRQARGFQSIDFGQTVNEKPLNSDAKTQAAAAEPAQNFVERRDSKTDRRKVTLRSFLQGALKPQRRTGRRASDKYMPLDWHDPYLMFLALVMLVLSVTDAFMTVRLLGDGAVESNPVLAFVLNDYPGFFAVAKMTLTGLGIVLLVAVGRSRLFGVITGRQLFEILSLAYLVLVGYEVRLVSLMQ